MDLYQKQSYTAAPKVKKSLDMGDDKGLSASNIAARGPSNAEIKVAKTTPTTPTIPTVLEPDSISGAVNQTTQTYREQAESINKGSFLEAAESFENIMGRPAPFSTQEEYLQWRANQNQEDLNYLEQQQGYSREIEKMQWEQAKQQTSGATAGMTANLAQGREGAMSGTAPMFTGEFREEMGRQMKQIEIQKASAERSREKAMIDLQRAQEAGDMDMVSAIEGKIASIENQLRETDSQALQMATLAEQQSLEKAKFEHSASMDVQANYRANFDAFNGLVASGVQMTTDQISAMAQGLNVPFEVANSFYQSAQNIREDKSLDVQTKQLMLAEAAHDFDEKLSGIRGAQAQAVNDFYKISQSGNYNQEQLRAFATAMNIPNDMNPLYKAELQAQTLSNLFTQKQMSGQPVTAADYNARAELLSNLSLMGQTLDENGNIVNLGYSGGGVDNATGYLPTSPIQGFRATLDGGVLNIEAPRDANGKVIPFQCGAAVNRVWGLSSGSSGGMGDSYDSKKTLVNKNGIKSSDITNPDTQIVPGMAFVMGLPDTKYAQNGHTGFVKQNLGNGQFLTAEWNWDGKGGYSEQVRSADQMYGFAFPPKDKAQIQSSNNMAIVNLNDNQILQLYEQAGQIFSDVKSQKQAITAAREANFIPGLQQTDTGQKEYSDKEFTQINQLYNRYNDVSKEIRELDTGFSFLNTYNVNTASGADDLALIYAFNKVMDPRSVVREGEFNIAAQTGSYLDQLGAKMANLQSGERLKPEQRQAIVNTMNTLYTQRKGVYKPQLQKAVEAGSKLGIADPSVYLDYLPDELTNKTDYTKDSLGIGVGGDSLGLGI